MTNEEAKLILEQYIPKPSRGNGKSTQTLIITEAILLAIKALDEQINTQRPKGKWLLQEYYIPVKQTALPTVCKNEYDFFISPTAVESKYMYICSNCRKKYILQSNFCSNCGAEMEAKE